MQPTMSRTATGPVGDLASLAARVLCCPECRGPLTGELLCNACGRSLTPGSDGIIGALPLAMQRAAGRKEELQHRIAGEADQARDRDIVLYEQAFHDEQAGYYDHLFADPLPLRRYYQRLVGRQIRSYVAEAEFVVDLCCGTGKSSLPLVAQGSTVVAIDVSREMLRTYQRKCAERGFTRVLFIHADASHPPLRAASCAAIVMLGGLHHIQEQAACVSTCADALAPSGLLILHEPLQSGQRSRLARVLENIYALLDPARVRNAVLRRLGAKVPPRAAAEPVDDFTPYEKPFKSVAELLAIMPEGMSPVELRSQGVLSFREFPRTLQNALGAPLASAIVATDARLSRSKSYGWAGDALFAVMRKS